MNALAHSDGVCCRAWPTWRSPARLSWPGWSGLWSRLIGGVVGKVRHSAGAARKTTIPACSIGASPHAGRSIISNQSITWSWASTSCSCSASAGCCGGQVKTSEDFFLSGRSIPAWIARAGLHLGQPRAPRKSSAWAPRAPSTACMTSHFYWLGADPGDGVRGHLHDAVLLRLARRARCPSTSSCASTRRPAASTPSRSRYDHLLLGHLDVRAGQAARAAAGLELQRQHRALGASSCWSTSSSAG